MIDGNLRRQRQPSHQCGTHEPLPHSQANADVAFNNCEQLHTEILVISQWPTIKCSPSKRQLLPYRSSANEMTRKASSLLRRIKPHRQLGVNPIQQHRHRPLEWSSAHAEQDGTIHRANLERLWLGNRSEALFRAVFRKTAPVLSTNKSSFPFRRTPRAKTLFARLYSNAPRT